MTYQKGEHVSLSTNFNLSEFQCPCPQCTIAEVDPDLITKLEALREKTGPLKITSGYRCEHYQNELRLRGYETAVGISQHQLGRAADVTTPDHRYTGTEIEKFARESGFKAVGVAPTWCHVDLRSDKERRWLYGK